MIILNKQLLTLVRYCWPKYLNTIQNIIVIDTIFVNAADTLHMGTHSCTMWVLVHYEA